MFSGLLRTGLRAPSATVALRSGLLWNTAAHAVTSSTATLWQPQYTLPPQSSSSSSLQQFRSVHSNRQVKRKFKTPRRDRQDALLGIDRSPTPPEKVEYAPIWEPNILPNGWCKPPPEEVTVPEYPFTVERTKNKPFNAVGFLPIYIKLKNNGHQQITRIKKVKGDRERFIQELKAVLNIWTPKNPKENKIRVRVGGTIEVKGNHVRKVREWLYGLGF